MANFRVNDNVIVKATGQRGTIVHREVINDVDAKRTTVQYFVKFGAGKENFGWFSRKDLTRVVTTPTPLEKTYTKVYDAPNGFKVTVVALVDTYIDGVEYHDDDDTWHVKKVRRFRLGMAFYNPVDEYDANFGYRFARHRAVEKPFCLLNARFLGEFNEVTVNALMDAKAQYVIEHFADFVK